MRGWRIFLLSKTCVWDLIFHCLNYLSSSFTLSLIESFTFLLNTFHLFLLLLFFLFNFLLFFLKTKNYVFFPLTQHCCIGKKNAYFFILNFRIYFLNWAANQSDHSFSYIGEKIVFWLILRNKVINKMAFQDNKKFHFLPLLICDFGPSWNYMFFINILNILFNKFEILAIFLFAENINTLFEFLKQKVTKKNLYSLDMNVRNIRIVLCLSCWRQSTFEHWKINWTCKWFDHIDNFHVFIKRNRVQCFLVLVEFQPIIKKFYTTEKLQFEVFEL